MKCKKEIMGIAALMVVFFHFYIMFGTSMAETFVFRSSFIGVDLFFFVSAYSLVSRNSKVPFKFGSFILNRLGLIYVPFVVLAIIQTIYKKWAFLDFIRAISGVQFFERGGGAFLWYFIGIMIIYLLFPLFLLVRNKLGKSGFIALMAFWCVVAVVFQFLLNKNQLFILINRLPIFFVGMYYDELIRNPLLKFQKGIVLIISLLLTGAGGLLVYKYAVASRLIKPFADMYYIIAIPMIIGVVMLVDTIVRMLEGKYNSVILKFIGGITLELYGLQMIFGYDIEIAMLKKIMTWSHPVKQLAFVGTLISLIIMAFIFNKLIEYSRRGIYQIKTKFKGD